MSGLQTKIGAGATLAALGGLAGYALHGGDRATTLSQAASPVPEVRTQVITKTVRVVRHQKPRHKRNHGLPSGGSGAPATRLRVASAAAGPTSIAAAAPARPVATAAPTYSAPRTRTSGGHAGAPSGGRSTAPVRSAPHHVTTRTSGGGERDDRHKGGHDE